VPSHYIDTKQPMSAKSQSRVQEGAHLVERISGGYTRRVPLVTYLTLPLPTRYTGAADAPPLLVAVVAGILFALPPALGGRVVL
jgi:hypothetical protein